MPYHNDKMTLKQRRVLAWTVIILLLFCLGSLAVMIGMMHQLIGEYTS